MIGKTGTVRCHKRILNSVSLSNDVGGTSELPVGNYRVKVTRHWTDGEIGDRCAGFLLDPQDIETSRIAGTTGYTPDDYQAVNPNLYQSAVDAAAIFNPRLVYFAADDFTPD